jgi:hypothetical protein
MAKLDVWAKHDSIWEPYSAANRDQIDLLSELVCMLLSEKWAQLNPATLCLG